MFSMHLINESESVDDHLGDFCGPALEVAYITSLHTPLRRAHFHSHIYADLGITNIYIDVRKCILLITFEDYEKSTNLSMKKRHYTQDSMQKLVKINKIFTNF